MSDVAASRKQLKIKSSAVKRILKEVGLYKKEAAAQKVKVDKLVADAAEEWDIKNGHKMLEESEKMIRDSEDRLAKSTGDLRDLVINAKTEAALENDEELLKAEEVLEEANM